jgi:5'-nucleotidase
MALAVTARIAGSAVAVVALVCSSLVARSDAIGIAAVSSTAPEPTTFTLSVVATTDLHGVIFPSGGQGGLALFGGYVKALRDIRASDGGAVLLVDAGDTFQGGIESDLSEGAVVVDAYNALGYAAAAIGNHEFDFGAVDLEGAREGTGDRHGAVKARARQARYPFLAANLIGNATGRPVAWPNVRPSVMVEAGPIKVGVVGVMTTVALRATLPANSGGLHVAPLAPAIQGEASKLRAAGADVVLVVSHAGGRCTSFGEPSDLSSCDEDAEIFQVARALPRGLVDVIAAGHTHESVAHVVNGIAIVQAYPRGQGFARADVVLDRRSKQLTGLTIHPSHPICAPGEPRIRACGPAAGPSATIPPIYEGRPVAPDPAVVAAMAPALARVRALQALPLGVTLDAPLLRDAGLESPLGNAFADALLAGSAGADVAVTNNRIGGLRADLPAGPLTFGRLYDVFPFDNRIVRLTLTGAELARALVDEINRQRPGTLAISGLQVRASCAAGHPDGRSDNSVKVTLYRPSGEPVAADERVVVATVDSLAAGAVFSPVRAPGPLIVGEDAPLLREVVERWFRQQKGPVASARFVDSGRPRWDYRDGLPSGCGGNK